MDDIECIECGGPVEDPSACPDNPTCSDRCERDYADGLRADAAYDSWKED